MKKISSAFSLRNYQSTTTSVILTLELILLDSRGIGGIVGGIADSRHATPKDHKRSTFLFPRWRGWQGNGKSSWRVASIFSDMFWKSDAPLATCHLNNSQLAAISTPALIYPMIYLDLKDEETVYGALGARWMN